MAMALVNVSGSCNCTVSVVSRHRAVELVFGTEACAQVCGINMYALKDQHNCVSCAGSYYIMHIQDPNERRGLRRCSRCVTPSEWRRWRPGPANSYFGRFEGPRLQIRESEYIIGDPTFYLLLSELRLRPISKLNCIPRPGPATLARSHLTASILSHMKSFNVLCSTEGIRLSYSPYDSALDAGGTPGHDEL